MKPTVYLETTVISYLTAKPSRDLIVAAHQQITIEWWEKRREHFQLYISEFVSLESAKGDVQAAEKRMNVLKQLEMLEITKDIRRLATIILDKRHLPPEAVDDALHIATATVHRMDYLATWNCKHIANAEIEKAIASIVSKHGYTLPYICTPEELLGE